MWNKLVINIFLKTEDIGKNNLDADNKFFQFLKTQKWHSLNF